MTQILPILAELSRVFQRNPVDLTLYTHLFRRKKDKLRSIPLQKVFIETMKQDKILLQLGLGNEDGSLIQEAGELKIFVQTYISALCKKIDARFNTSLPVLSAFGIFDPLMIPKIIRSWIS